MEGGQNLRGLTVRGVGNPCGMATNKMEMKEIAKHKTLWKMNSTSEPLLVTGVDVSPLKKFTIPKIRRTAGKVYLSPCCTNTREYSFIHDTLNQCRLDVSCDLQSSWQFGDTKLVHNEDLEKNFASKRSEMRESGRHGRELEEHFCFLALPQRDVAEIYRNGISTKASTLKILGNPLLGIYIFRHVDVALNYAHSRSITVESIIIFKVYFYEYNVLSKPVDKPRQCLPYAIVTVKFIGQKVDNGHFMTSLRFLSTGFPKRAERTCSLNNCTVAKRIGKGKDATVIFEHFRKPVDPFVQENCSCNTLNSEINPPDSNISNSYGNVQNGNISVLETHSGQMEHNVAECGDTSQVHAQDSALSFIPSDTRESVSGDLLLDLTQLKNILSGLSAAFPVHNNIDSSTVITSKLIKDPRLMRREERVEKHNNITGLNEILPFQKSLDVVDSEINLTSMPINSVSSSKVIPGDHAILTNCLDAPGFAVSFDDSQSQAHIMGSNSCNYTPSNIITLAGQHEGQDNFSFPMCLSNVVSEVENQNHSEEKAQRSQQRSNIPLLIEQNSKPHNSYESVNTSNKGNNSHISRESQSSNLETNYQTGHQMATVLPLQRKESIHEYIQNTGKMRHFTGPEDNLKQREKQNWWKETDNYFTNETKISPVDNYISLHEEFKEVESPDSSGKNCDQILITQELEIPKSSTSTTKHKYELDHLALELQNSLTPRGGNLSQKHPQYSLEYEDNIHTSFAIYQNLMELKLEKPNQNCVSIMTDAFQEAKDIPPAKELPIDTVISSHDTKTARDNSVCNIAREHICVRGENQNDPLSLENIQRDCKETSQIDDKGQDYSQFCNAQLNNDIHLNIDFKEQRDNDKANQNEAKEEDIASSTENSIEYIYGDEKQSFHTNKNFTNIGERRENKNYNSVEILSSKGFCTTLNLTWGKKCVSTETTLLGSGDSVSVIKQKDIQNSGRSVEHLASTTFPVISDSSVHVASNAAVQIADTVMPALGTNHEHHQRYQFKETCSSESPDFGLLVTHRVSDCEMDVGKNKLHDSCHQSISDNPVLLSFENEIEVGSERCDYAFLFQQDTQSRGSVLCEEFGASYEALQSRIDWEGLSTSSNGETEVLKSTTRRENSDQHYSEESNSLYSTTQKNKAQLFNPVLLPDLQVSITNIFMPGDSPTVESVALKDNFCKYITEATKPEINEEEGEVPKFRIYSQCSGENLDYSREDEFGNMRHDSEPVSKSEISLSFNLSRNSHVNQMSEKQNSELLLTEPSNVTTINNESRCSLTRSKTDCIDARSKKDTEARISKRKPHTLFRDQNIPRKDLRHHEISETQQQLTSQGSSECFSALSQGRIKTFSLSEKHIRSVLDILNSEASLCKSKRLSRRLDRAVLHLKKAHRRVHTSLQLIAKVGEKRKGPLPKSYAIICNNFWESCDLHGYSSVSERRYYSPKHFLSKRKYDKPGEKRALGFEVNKSLTPVSKHKSYKTSGERSTECLSKKNVASSVSRSHTTIHMREFCDQEYPESQLPLCSTSQSTSQSTYNNSSMRNPRSSELQPFSGKTGCLFSLGCPDAKLTKKENQTDKKFLSNISKYEELENHSAHNIKDATKENNSEANEVINKSNSVSVSCIKENNVSFSTDKNYDATCMADTKVKTDIVISVLESNVKHFLDVDIYKPDNLILSGYKGNLEVNFPVEKWIAPNENSEPGIITGTFFMNPLNLTLISSKKSNSIPQLSTTLVTDSEGESHCLDKQRIFAIDSFATSTNVPPYQQECGGKELLKTEQCSSSNCFHIDGNETNVIENSELGLTSVNEENKCHGENTMKKLFSSDSSLLLKDNIKDSSSKKCIAKKNIQDRKMWKVKQAEQAKDLIHKKSVPEGSTVKIEHKNQKNKILEESSCLSEKTIKNNLIDSHLSIKNATEAVSLNNTISNQPNKREKERGVKVNDDSHSDSILHSEIACNSIPGIIGMNHMPVLHAHSETSKITTPQKKPTSYVNELKEKHCSANHSALIVRLTQILRRADEASSLQTLQEERNVCQNILPLFVEAFERKQECSVEQILISRELLVEQNLWNNCKHKLKPCAIDSLVELQMMMETIQFIENKKRLLGGEPTFRSLLWYDESLYSELLGRPRGFQQQSNFYPAFQGRLKYNAFCELQNYLDQLIELFEETKRENNSYYAFLKYKRQINECEAIMKHCSDCFDFSLSVPFTCGVNFGDSLGDLETLRKSTLKLISMYGDSPKVHSYPGKQDHLWIIIEMIASKVNFIKSNEALSIKISLYGLEHIFFDAAKSLVWKERRRSFSKKDSGKKNKEMLLRMNQYAFSKLQKIYDTLSKDLSSEQNSNIGLEENTIIASRKSDDLVNKAAISIGNCRFNSTLLSHPDICFISEILDQAEFADFKKLQELTLRCTDHLEILKKSFQRLQEDNIDNIFITEENVVDMLKNHNHEAVILKPAAIETYIDIVMLSETVHFLKNSMAKKLDKQRFRGMLWFDLSLLPELVRCQEKMASFSFLKDNSTDCLWRVIETSISELKKDLDIIYKYNEAVNCSYALHLFSRELEELSEIKKLLKKSKYSISTYIDFVPYIASINYGSTLTELEYNYNQFSTLLKNIMAAPRKDLGKMAHIMKVMKTIEHMKIICAKNATLTISFILCQMLHNSKKTFQLERKEKMNIHVKPRKSINKSSTCMKVPSVSECIMKNVSSSSKKRPLTIDKWEDSQEQEKNTTVSSCKKQKINMKDVTEINREMAAFKHPRTTRSHPETENEIAPSSSDNLKRNDVSPKKVEMHRSLPGSLLPLKNLKDTCTSKSEGKIDLANISSDTSEDFTGQQGDLNSMKKRDVNFSAAETESHEQDCSFAICDQKSVEGTFSKDHETLLQKFLKNSPDPPEQSCPSHVKPGTDASLLPDASVLSKPIFRFVRDVHANLEMNDTVFELQDNEILNSSVKNCTSSPEPIFVQNKIPVLHISKTQPAKIESKEKYIKDTLNPSTIPVEASGNITLNVNQTAECSFSEQQKNENSKVLTQNAAAYWNELPQSACTPIYNSSEHSFGTSYPYYAWCVYHYSSSNGNSITQTYQGITSYEVQPSPSGMLTAVASTVQNTHSNLLYSQYFGYFAGEPQANDFVPVTGYFPSQMPVSYNFQQPIFSQYASYQPLPQDAYPYPPDSGVLPEVPWTSVPWQQEPFQPGR
ncbi:PREDICTED: testis-expressed sequence 15 protein [Ceratotherium simum simum]|uniref:Testis-expressed sequence 15 protein n=1 Tax=Ceratotherium simum simum TaxID=73337 RepID=A0ABM1CQL6_CERSS|nr:PREDICTED: testis-expressed sequence 15 protein [Ceratotherium simum simum]